MEIGYNPDGSRAEVSRDDALNGQHRDFYFYEEASGRLQSVLDVWTGEVNQFAWNAEGTLARWVSPVPTSDGEKIIYERQFEYNELGVLTRFWRREGENALHLLQEFRYNGDGCLVEMVNYWENKAYRFGSAWHVAQGFVAPTVVR